MKISFLKVEAQSNDFILLNSPDLDDQELSKLSKLICDRKYGIGSDGLIIVRDIKETQCRMLFFNPDGTRDVCGNGMRCVASYLTKYNGLKTDFLNLLTDAGERKVEILKKGTLFRVCLGEARCDAESLPASIAGNYKDYELEVHGRKFRATSVNTSSLHTVIFVDNLEFLDFENLAQAIENHELFTERTSVEFVKKITDEEVQILIWERGVGESLACGTGAAAVCYAGVAQGMTSETLSIVSKGGTIKAEFLNGEMYQSGDVRQVFNGEYIFNG